MPSTINFSVQLLESDSIIERKILENFAEEFNNSITSKISNIKQQLKYRTVEFIKGTATYFALVDGILASHFGLPLSSRKLMVDNIINTVANNIEIENKSISIRGGNFYNGLEIRVLLVGFSDILALSDAVITTNRGQDLPWLEWLLIRGDKIIISEYEIDLISGKGRSGGAIMVRNDASVWRVPPMYAGTINSNWLTKTILSQEYKDIIEEILQKELM